MKNAKDFINSIYTEINKTSIQSFTLDWRPFIELEGFEVSNFVHEEFGLTYIIKSTTCTGIVLTESTINFLPEEEGTEISIDYRNLSALNQEVLDINTLIELEKIYKTLTTLVEKFQPQIDNFRGSK